MLSEEERLHLRSLAENLKEKNHDFFDKIIGKMLMGSMSGYLGIYATCAIETEEDGHNAEGHARKTAVEMEVQKLGRGINLLITCDDELGKNCYFDEAKRCYYYDEENLWKRAIKDFLETREPIRKFFDTEKEEGTNRRFYRQFTVMTSSYAKLEESTVTSMSTFCDIMITRGRRIDTEDLIRYKSMFEEMRCKPSDSTTAEEYLKLAGDATRGKL